MTKAYDPRTDSSAGYPDYGDNPALRNDPNADNPGFDLDTTVILEVGTGHGEFRLCNCGCLGKVANSKRLFIQGHDQRLVGKLTRAALAGAEVAISDGGSLISGNALGVAARLGLSDRGQAKLVRAVQAGEARVKATKPELAPIWASADAVKIGRWTYPARTNGTTTERNAKRDGSGAWLPIA